MAKSSIEYKHKILKRAAPKAAEPEKAPVDPAPKAADPVEPKPAAKPKSKK